MKVEVNPHALFSSAVALAALFAVAPVRADAVSDAKAAVAKYAGCKPPGRGRPRRQSLSPARRSCSCPATSRTIFLISTASTSRRRARSWNKKSTRRIALAGALIASSDRKHEGNGV